MTVDPLPVGKIADAAKEIAKTGGKVIDATSSTGRFFNRVFGDFAVDGVGLIGDRLKFYRLEQAILLATKVQQRLADKGIEATLQVNPKIALPLIEFATLENDEDLHSLWANLLANALSDAEKQVERKFVTVLAELTNADARILAHIFQAWKGPKHSLRYDQEQYSISECVHGTSRHDPISIITLNRLGLITPPHIDFLLYRPPSKTDADSQASFVSMRTYGGLEAVALTQFGESFCNAVDTDTMDIGTPVLRNKKNRSKLPRF